MIEKKASKNLINALSLSFKEVKNMTGAEKSKLSEGIRHFEESMNARLQEEILISVVEKKKKKKKKGKKVKKEETSL